MPDCVNPERLHSSILRAHNLLRTQSTITTSFKSHAIMGKGESPTLDKIIVIRLLTSAHRHGQTLRQKLHNRMGTFKFICYWPDDRSLIPNGPPPTHIRLLLVQQSLRKRLMGPTLNDYPSTSAQHLFSLSSIQYALPAVQFSTSRLLAHGLRSMGRIQSMGNLSRHLI